MPFLNPNVDLYSRAPKDPALHGRNFFLQYRDIYDPERFSLDRENYRKMLLDVWKTLRGINFNQNVLIICAEMVHREVFFYALSTMTRYLSHAMFNAEQISDIWWGNHREEGTQSEQDLNYRLLCIYGDKSFWINEAAGQILNTVLCSRTSGNRSDNRSQYTWIFYRGTMSDIQKNNINDKTNGWTHVLDLYRSMKDQGYLIIDLNEAYPNFVSLMEQYNIAWIQKRTGIEKKKNPHLYIPPKGPKIIGADSKNPDLDY